jgi:hypothetical protein
MLEVSGRTGEAEELYRRTYETLRDRMGIDFPQTTRSFQRLGMMLTRLGRFDEACEVLDDALAAMEDKLGTANGRSMFIRFRAAECYAACGDLAAAPMMREVVDRLDERDTMLKPQMNAALGNLLRRHAEYAAEAEARLGAALLRGNGPERTEAGYGLACMALDVGNDSQASDLLDDVLRVKLSIDGETWAVVASRALRASLEFKLRPSDADRALIERDLDTLQATLGTKHVAYRELTRGRSES